MKLVVKKESELLEYLYEVVNKSKNNIKSFYESLDNKEIITTSKTCYDELNDKKLYEEFLENYKPELNDGVYSWVGE